MDSAGAWLFSAIVVLSSFRHQIKWIALDLMSTLKLISQRESLPIFN